MTVSAFAQPSLRFCSLFVLLLLVGCSVGLEIDTTYTSRNQDSRVRFLVLHYTVSPFESALEKLTTGKVSSHYLVSDGRDGKPVRIYGLVDESQRAWHAGPSEWLGHTQLNEGSIGIEIVNRGLIDVPGGAEFEPFPTEQTDAVIALVKDIVERHQIRPERIVGHSDIQPHRKLDPGPRFPWKRLADLGLIRWPDAGRVAEYQASFSENPPSIPWIQERLVQLGFGANRLRSGSLDEATCNVLGAFQMKYRPSRFDGEPDAETAAILGVLTDEP